jgi:GT2 family glycosyltransferase
MVVTAPPADGLRRTLVSLDAQSDTGWSLTVVTPKAWTGACREVLTTRRRRPATVVTGPDGTPTSGLLRMGLPAEDDATVALVFPGDAWAPRAVALLRAALRQHDVAYADEDRIDADGRHVHPMLKPAYSPDFLLASAYVGRPLAFRANLIRDLEFSAADLGELEHECALAACEAAGGATHVPEVLCHRTVDPAAPVRDLAHVQAALWRRHDESTVEPGRVAGTFRVVRRAPAGIAVSVIIPFRDQPQFLRACVDSVRATASDADLDLLLVDNGSSDLETLTLMERLSALDGLRLLHDPRPFNWAQLNNLASREAAGEVLLFLNNDIEASGVGWLDALVAQALRPEIGAAGARLLYPNQRVQHCGVVVGLGGAAGHPLVGLDGAAPGYLNMATVTRECSAVTGACLATRRAVFEELGGFDETLGVDLNDVDYCLRAARAGYRTVFEPAAELIHHESPSRGTAGGLGDIVRFIERWKNYIAEGDRYLNPRITRTDVSCALATAEEVETWNQWYSTVTRQ